MQILRLGFAAVAALALFACGAPADGNDEGNLEAEAPVGETKQKVQLNYPLSDYEQVIENTTMAQAKSTGAIRATNVDANTNNGSCGLTFVSKHYAVTAGHCVQHLPLNGSVQVEQYTTTNLNTPAIILSSSLVVGDWPNWVQGIPLQSWDGYSVTSMTCQVKRRCSAQTGGVQACPAQVSGPYGNVDIAMLFCPTRNNANFATTTAASTVNRDIEIFWFHEILNLTTTPSTTDQYWMHYGELTNVRNDNFHYRVRHQLFPLRSTGRPRPFNSLLNYKDLSDSGAYSGMDTPICHGTSGSGVFLNGQNVFIGPVISGGSVWKDAQGNTHSTLCHLAEQTVAGQVAASHVRGVVTNAFVVNSPEVMADR